MLSSNLHTGFHAPVTAAVRSKLPGRRTSLIPGDKKQMFKGSAGFLKNVVFPPFNAVCFFCRCAARAGDDAPCLSLVGTVSIRRCCCCCCCCCRACARCCGASRTSHTKSSFINVARVSHNQPGNCFSDKIKAQILSGGKQAF